MKLFCFALIALASVFAFAFPQLVLGQSKPSDVWPDLAPGETTRNVGEVLPYRPNDNPRITRVIGITRPTFTVHLASKPNGSAVVILPGGGFGKVVPDLEGTEAAEWLNRHGIAAFVVSYRTKADKNDPGWKRALQDAQRTLSLIRSRADEFGLKKDRIGLLGFSAGGQVAARLLSADGKLAYDRIDEIDDVSNRPNFALLIYPWNIYDNKQDGLIEGVSVSSDCPPTFLVHTDDDRSTSLGAVLFYAGLKRHGIPAEIHVYGNGGHGYGIRPVDGSEISSWTVHATHWLNRLSQ
jgi:acetyl esterase/lipase